jgi:hypothetical protein
MENTVEEITELLQAENQKRILETTIDLIQDRKNEVNLYYDKSKLANYLIKFNNLTIISDSDLKKICEIIYDISSRISTLESRDYYVSDINNINYDWDILTIKMNMSSLAVFSTKYQQ